MSYSLPIVGLKQNGLKMISKGNDSLLVDIDNSMNIAYDLGKNIEKLINDDKLREELSKNAYENIKEYTWSKKIMEVSKEYERIVKNI